MDEAAHTADRADPERDAPGRYQPPRFEVIPLDCEITAYAPDGDPLF